METIMEKKPMIIFKKFNEYPDAFEEYQKMPQYEYIGFLVSIIEDYLAMIQQEQKRKLKVLDYIHIRERLNVVNQTNELGDLGSYTIKDIPLALYSIVKYLVNERNKNEQIYGNQDEINNAMFFFLKKFLGTHLQLILEKFELK